MSLCPSGGLEEAEEGEGGPGDPPLPALPVQGGLQGGLPLWRRGPLL